MKRALQGKYVTISTVGEKAHAFVPLPLPPLPASPFSWICGYATAPEGMVAVGENRTDLPPGYLPFPCR